MIPKFVKRYTDNKRALYQYFTQHYPEDYEALVRQTLTILVDEEDWNYPSPDVERITKIDYGDYQGTLVFVVSETGYQPSQHWAVVVDYGSCSGCDTLEAIRDYSGGLPTAEQVQDYMVLSLHIVEGLQEIGRRP